MPGVESRINNSLFGGPDRAEMEGMLRAVTQYVIGALKEFEEKGVTPPWHKPWMGSGLQGMATSVAIGGLKYPVTNVQRCLGVKRGTKDMVLNQMILSAARHAIGYETNFWVTRTRIRNVGARIRDDNPVLICDMGNYLPRSMPVYNIEQVENFEQALGLTVRRGERIRQPNSGKSRFEKAKKFSDELQYGDALKLRHDSPEAYYSPGTDEIHMPHMRAFMNHAELNERTKREGEGHYWATFFHECIHWTGHHSRCGRFGRDGRYPGSTRSNNRVYYAEEEIVAELGSAYLCAYLGIDGELQHPEYIKNWIEELERRQENETHPVIKASVGASLAFTYLKESSFKGRKKMKIDSDGDAPVRQILYD